MRRSGETQDLSLVEFARQYQRARGMNQTILPLPLPDTAARGMGFCREQRRTRNAFVVGLAGAAVCGESYGRVSLPGPGGF